MAKIFIYTIFIFLSLSLFGQKKIDQIIPNAQAKKVELAKRYFNQQKIYEGEKVLSELINDYPSEPYYREALAILKRQVLRRILYSSKEMINANDEDSLDTTVNKTSHLIKDTKDKYQSLIINSGLDRISFSEQEDKIKHKRKQNDIELEESQATVIIDSSLLNTKDEEDMNATGAEAKENLKRLKYLKTFSDIPFESYKNSLIENARQTTRLFETADSSSVYLREFLVDTVLKEGNFSEIDLEKSEQAFQLYREKDFLNAKKIYTELVQSHAKDALLLLKLGDCYAEMGIDSVALKNYQLALDIDSRLSLAMEKIAYVYYNQGQFLKAAASIIAAIEIYPNQHYLKLLKRITDKSGKSFESQWIQRQVFPATTSRNYEEIVVDSKSPWWHYQAAKQEVFSYFDTIGIMRPNEKTRERYLEIYTWKKMLNNSSPNLFSFARAMNQMGYLDCYTLITLFHQDLYGQFNDFVKRNPEKVKEYFYILINWEDKKFDKIRQMVKPKSVPKKDN